MKYTVPNSLLKFAHSVAKIPFAKKILKPIYYPYKNILFKKRQENFRKNALEMLASFDKCCQENSIDYFIIFGTLLGAIREKGFISHDFDVDVAMFVENRSSLLYDKLASYGFRLDHRFRIENGKLGCEETFVYKETGVAIDVFYVCPPINEYPYVCCWNLVGDSVSHRDSMKKYGYVIPRRIELPIDKHIERIPFETIEVNIPQNAHQISEFSYGKNYMTPDPNYVAPKEHRVIWTEKKAIFEEFC